PRERSSVPWSSGRAEEQPARSARNLTRPGPRVGPRGMPKADPALDIDGERCFCPRCGLAFTLTVQETAPVGVYRDAAVVDLIPFHDRKPLLGLRETKGARLDIVVGSALLPNMGLLKWSILLYCGWMICVVLLMVVGLFLL